MLEKRKHKRSALLYYLKIVDLETGRLIGRLADISLGGLKLVSESHIPSGRNFLLKVCFPDDKYCQKSFEVKAKSCWTKADVNPDYFASGFCFDTLSIENVKMIKNLLQQYAMNNSASEAL